jgi:predicted 3-demethylubiquinone-9 3-methyltransferase (glyoxalase superfamily)
LKLHANAKLTPASRLLLCQRIEEEGRSVADAGPYGWLKDRYGVSWQIVPTRVPELLGDPDPEKSQRVMQAILSMKKIEIDALERAAAQV